MRKPYQTWPDTENPAAAAYLASVLADYGYQVEIQEVPLPNGSWARNVIAVLEEAGVFPPGEDSRRTLVIGGHFDTKRSHSKRQPHRTMSAQLHLLYLLAHPS